VRLLVELADAELEGEAGAKAARLALAMQHGLPVLPSWVVPVTCARPALRAGATAIAERGAPAGRRAVLTAPVPEQLDAELKDAVHSLGGRVIIRSSSPLESDARWSGAFSSVAEVGPADVATAVRSVWASAFAVDPMERMHACGLAPESMDMAALIQPEITPDFGGTARIRGDFVHVEGVRGHPGAMLAGWADGESATVHGAVVTGGLARLINPDNVHAVGQLMSDVYRMTGDNTIEWASTSGSVHLLQSHRSPVSVPASPPTAGSGAGGSGTAGSGAAGLRATPAAPGSGIGQVLYRCPHQPLPRGAGDLVLLVDHPVPALAPLLFAGRADDGAAGVTVRAVIARSGPAGSHLAEVARALGVPMVTACPIDPATSDGAITVMVDGTHGVVKVCGAPVQLQGRGFHVALKGNASCAPTPSLSAMLAVYDTMQYIQSPIATTCVGQAVARGQGTIPDLILQAAALEYGLVDHVLDHREVQAAGRRIT
jgi:hypothetical protein